METGHEFKPCLGAKCCLALLKVYRRYISCLKGPCCRFSPSCSQYAVEAFSRLPFFRAFGLTVWRIMRCHPFYHGNLNDPVPEYSQKSAASIQEKFKKTDNHTGLQ